MNATRIAVIGVIALSLAVATARAQYTADYQTNTISGVTNDWADDYLVGYTNFADVLLIQNSGVLTNHDGYLGYDSSSSNNSVLVTGPGSVWSNTYALYVGYSGAGNSLVISNGGQVVNYYRYGCMGYNFNSSNNSVLVTGAGSVWSASEELDVGYSGAGNSLVISDGGLVVSLLGGHMGYDSSSSSNSVLVTGAGSVWSASEELDVGYWGGGNSLVISNGGLVVNDIGYVGSWGSSSNSVLVTGPGSVWTNGEVDVGYSGAGNILVISDGGQVLTGPSCDYYGDGYMGYDSSSTNNSVLVTGRVGLEQSLRLGRRLLWRGQQPADQQRRPGGQRRRLGGLRLQQQQQHRAGHRPRLGLEQRQRLGRRLLGRRQQPADQQQRPSGQRRRLGGLRLQQQQQQRAGHRPRLGLE